jgi:hypothetical protein
MASLLDSVGRIVHETATSLIERQVTTKIAAAVTTVVETGFGVIDDALKIVQDATAPDDATKPPEPRGNDSI